MSASPPRSSEGTPAPAISIAALRHPSEESRLRLALAATAIVFGVAAELVVAAAGWLALGILAGVLVLFGALIWLGLQIYRARLLGHAVKVTPDSLPELHSALEDVRARLDYHRRVDVYVIEKANPSTQLTSYLGTRVLVLEGNLIADLVNEDPARITFLLARFIGALKARHDRFTPVLVVLMTIESLKFLFFFLAPYYRATVYSGDQIAQVACGSFPAALSTTERLLAGKQIEGQLRAPGLIGQHRSCAGGCCRAWRSFFSQSRT